jgi:uncharacterized protein involved in exopolysaccharide biosynthesis
MEEDTLNIFDFIEVIWKRKWVVILLTLMSTLLAMAVAQWLPVIYEAKTTLLITPPKIKSELSMNPMDLDSYKELALTPALLNRVIEEVDIKDNSGQPLIVEELQLRLDVEIPSSPGNKEPLTYGLLTLKAQGEDPGQTAKITNLWALLISNASKDIRASEAATVFNMVKEQFESTKALLGKIEDMIISKQGSLQLQTLKQSIFNKRNRLMTLNEKLAQINMGIKERQAGLHPINKIKKIAPDYSKPLSELNLSDIDLNKTITEASHIMTSWLDVQSAFKVSSNSPKNTSVSSSDPNSFGSLASPNRSDKPVLSYHSSIFVNENYYTPKVLEAYRKIIKNNERELEKAIYIFAEKDVEHDRMDRKKVNLMSSFLVLSKRLEDARILVTEKTSDIRFISKAIKPNIPVAPNKLIIVLAGLLAGFLISLFVAQLLEHLEQKQMRQKPTGS